MSTTTAHEKPEHLFEPDGFPTRILFVMLVVFIVGLFGAVWVLVAYFETSAQVALEDKDVDGSDLLRSVQAKASTNLTTYGFVACDVPADGNQPSTDLQCLPENAVYRTPYDENLAIFLERAQNMDVNPVAPLAEPPPAPPAADAAAGDAPTPPGQGADSGNGARNPPSIPPGRRLEKLQRPRRDIRRPVKPIRGQGAGKAAQPQNPPK